MGVKVYISGISGNKEVKKHQQRVLMILESKNIEYDVIDITEPGKEDQKEFMQQKANAKEAKYPLPPQIFNDEEYCGDYEEFDLANEVDELDKFLKLSASVSKAEITLGKSEQQESKGPVENGEVNGISSSRENSAEKEKTKNMEALEQDSKTDQEVAGDGEE